MAERRFERSDVLLAGGLGVLGGLLSLQAGLGWAVGHAVVPLPLAWRRTRPLVSACAAALVVSVFMVWSPPQTRPISFVVTILVATYSVAAHERPLLRASAGGLAVGVAAHADLLVRGDTGDDAFWVFRIFFVASAWVAGRVLHDRLREVERLGAERERTASAAVAAERGRIARELHDVIAHSVSVMVIQAGAAEQVLGTDPDAARPPLLSIQETGRETVTELRRLLGILRTGDPEATSAPQPTLNDVAILVERSALAGLPATLTIEGEPTPVPATLSLSAYRIVQESLTNALKHAGATVAHVTIRYRRDAVEIEVCDDGAGGSTLAGDGHGLLGIRERVAMFYGDVEAGPLPEGGFRLWAVLPTDGAA